MNREGQGFSENAPKATKYFPKMSKLPHINDLHDDQKMTSNQLRTKRINLNGHNLKNEQNHEKRNTTQSTKTPDQTRDISSTSGAKEKGAKTKLILRTRRNQYRRPETAPKDGKGNDPAEHQSIEGNERRERGRSSTQAHSTDDLSAQI